MRATTPIVTLLAVLISTCTAFNIPLKSGANAVDNEGSGGEVNFNGCHPDMDFQLGRGNRDAKEGTFLPTEAKLAEGQQDAKNPDIIMNRICDQLRNVCKVNDSTFKECQKVRGQVAALGTKDNSTAVEWNKRMAAIEVKPKKS